MREHAISDAERVESINSKNESFAKIRFLSSECLVCCPRPCYPARSQAQRAGVPQQEARAGAACRCTAARGARRGGGGGGGGGGEMRRGRARERAGLEPLTCRVCGEGFTIDDAQGACGISGNVLVCEFVSEDDHFVLREARIHCVDGVCEMGERCMNTCTEHLVYST